MTQDEFATYLESRFEAIRQLRKSGQKEYAHGSAFGNFERLADDLRFEGIDRRHVLWVYAKKHLDGIVSHLRGNISQREPVQGRIQDAILYLFLLMGMEDEDAGKVVDAPGVSAQPGPPPCYWCQGKKVVEFTSPEGTVGQECPWCQKIVSDGK